MRMIKRICLPAGALLLATGPATPVFAHPGHGSQSLLQGLAHPFSGLDHLLAMIAVGLWASVKGGKALWAWPASFVAAMLGGFALGEGGVVLPLAEPVILASVIVIGGCVAAAAPASTMLGAALVALFGLAHGYAHGVEVPGATISFPLGFMVSTIALHLIGISAGFGLGRLRLPILVRLLGASTAAGGLALAFAA